MNPGVNEVQAAKAQTAQTNVKPPLISAQARELLNLRRLPAMLNVQQTAVLLGLAEHDIPVLLNAGFLQSLGDPQPNAVKYFAAVQVLELAGEIAVLNNIRRAVSEYWRGKNAMRHNGEPRPCKSRRLRNGQR
jgi:hypothetical protein